MIREHKIILFLLLSNIHFLIFLKFKKKIYGPIGYKFSFLRHLLIYNFSDYSSGFYNGHFFIKINDVLGNSNSLKMLT